MELNSVCSFTCDKQNRSTAERDSDFLLQVLIQVELDDTKSIK